MGLSQHVIDQALANAHAQQQAQQQLEAVLVAALQSPSITRTLHIHKVAVTHEAADGRRALHVALPHGERLDIVLSADAARHVAGQLLDPKE